MLLQRSPVLFWALFFLLGCAIFFNTHWALSIPLAGLFFVSRQKTQGVVFLVVGLVYAIFQCPTVEHVEGRGIFQLEQIQPSTSPFGQSLILKGKLMAFAGHSHLPCVILVKKVPKGSKWIVEGQYEGGVLKCRKGMIWQELKSPFSLARWRGENKKKIQSYLLRHHPGAVGHFYSSITTGNICDRLQAMEFRKVGLGHFLAISGFHFALLAGVVSYFLRLFFPKRATYLILLALLSGYYLFLGFSPSVFRAYLMIGLFILGKLLRRSVDSINLLGIALLTELILDPRVCTQAGFQLSFFATLAILIWFSPCEQMLEKLLPKRRAFEVIHLRLLDQHGVLFASWIRKGAALNLAVHLATLPVALYIFGSFPLLSFVYNLVISPLLAVTIVLMPFGLYLPPLGYLNAKFTAALLKIIAHPPELLHFQLFSTHLPYWLVLLLVTLIGVIGLRKREEMAIIEDYFWRS